TRVSSTGPPVRSVTRSRWHSSRSATCDPTIPRPSSPTRTVSITAGKSTGWSRAGVLGYVNTQVSPQRRVKSVPPKRIRAARVGSAARAAPAPGGGRAAGRGGGGMEPGPLGSVPGPGLGRVGRGAGEEDDGPAAGVPGHRGEALAGRDGLRRLPLPGRAVPGPGRVEGDRPALVVEP